MVAAVDMPKYDNQVPTVLKKRCIECGSRWLLTTVVAQTRNLCVCEEHVSDAWESVEVILYRATNIYNYGFTVLLLDERKLLLGLD
jgi:hypothetical protein